MAEGRNINFPSPADALRSEGLQLSQLRRCGVGKASPLSKRREMLEPTELSITILRLRICCRSMVMQGLTFMWLVLVPVQETVVLDRLFVTDEAVRQLAVTA